MYLFVGLASFAPCDVVQFIYAVASSWGLSACVAAPPSIAGERHPFVTRSLGS